ncbi:hypothetical protein BLNAU_14994 [Blattamonas nauphoetae]|uniref:Uncharacterized protein n=1 Tax=Blattamonas nauphoetae TaxID=2049346 RepID=A0ABQ9XFF9_9EUKA|nr:hypothetical protein BLNAU_14994 [Blattamonas nauphoetae]
MSATTNRPRRGLMLSGSIHANHAQLVRQQREAESENFEVILNPSPSPPLSSPSLNNYAHELGSPPTDAESDTSSSNQDFTTSSLNRGFISPHSADGLRTILTTPPRAEVLRQLHKSNKMQEAHLLHKQNLEEQRKKLGFTNQHKHEVKTHVVSIVATKDGRRTRNGRRDERLQHLFDQITEERNIVTPTVSQPHSELSLELSKSEIQDVEEHLDTSVPNNVSHLLLDAQVQNEPLHSTADSSPQEHFEIPSINSNTSLNRSLSSADNDQTLESWERELLESQKEFDELRAVYDHPDHSLEDLDAAEAEITSGLEMLTTQLTQHRKHEEERLTQQENASMEQKMKHRNEFRTVLREEVREELHDELWEQLSEAAQETADMEVKAQVERELWNRKHAIREDLLLKWEHSTQAAMNEERVRLTDSISFARNEIEQITNTVTELQTNNIALQNMVNEQKLRLEKMKQERMEEKTQRRQKETQINEAQQHHALHQALQDAEQALGEMKQEKDRLRQENAKRDRRIADLSNQIRSTNNDLEAILSLWEEHKQMEDERNTESGAFCEVVEEFVKLSGK